MIIASVPSSFGLVQNWNFEMPQFTPAAPSIFPDTPVVAPQLPTVPGLGDAGLGLFEIFDSWAWRNRKWLVLGGLGLGFVGVASLLR